MNELKIGTPTGNYLVETTRGRTADPRGWLDRVSWRAAQVAS